MQVSWGQPPWLPKDIIKGCHLITGLPEIPPEKSFGYMQSSARVRSMEGAGYCGYISQEEVLNAAQRLGDENIPCDAITLDVSWSGNYGSTPEKVYDWTFCSSRFPEPTKMIEELKRMGFRLCVTQWPYIKRCFPDFSEPLFEPDIEGKKLTIELLHLETIEMIEIQ